ncbi:MAG TPA: amidohydrolase family protein, partial [Anaerolineales bacterium]
MLRLLFNARIHTQDAARPLASALLIDRERVVAAGDKDELSGLSDGKTNAQDMQGLTILPGMTDAHLHFKSYSLSLEKVDCETGTLEECLKRIAERARSTKAGEWILGHGWNQNEWLPSP